MVTLSGGDKLEKALAEIAKKVTQASELDVGFLSDATYPDGTSVAMVAAMNEFGTSKSPPRPFFRGMISEKSKEWPEAVAGLLVDNGYDATKTLEQTGAAIKGQLQETITTYVGPPLAESTVARKGNDKQLIDSGVMLKSAAYRVK